MVVLMYQSQMRAHLCVHKKATLHHVFLCCRPPPQSAPSYQEDLTKAGNLCEIITYEGQGHRVFNSVEHCDLTLAAADKFFIDCGWLSKQ
ncbi:MAG: hypothetical protein CMJ66_10820 [Planctomycetaceae bacterium]|nr:hypothetical protein [Planctomycetaceae bacterium]